MDIFEVISTIRIAFGCLLFAVLATIINNAATKESENWRKSDLAIVIDVISMFLVIYAIYVFLIK